MTISNRALLKKVGRGASLGLLLAGSLAVHLHAQDTAPAAPGGDAAVQGAPAPQGNTPVSILPEPDPNAPQDQAPDTSIATVELAAPGIDRLGLVSTGKGGFAPDLWKGTDPGFLKQILPLFPARVTSPAERRLAQNLLLSPGAPPVAAPAGEGAADGSPDGAEATSAAGGTPPAAGETIDAATLLLARVQNLIAMGDWTDTVALIDLVPADQMTAQLRRIHADAELASDHLNSACGDAQAALQGSSDVYWQKLQVFCQLTTEQSTAANLGLDVLREQKLDDPGFFWAADLIQGGRKPAPAAVTSLSPLLYAMIKNAGVALPVALAKAADPATMSMVARVPTADDGLPGDKPVTDPARRERQRKAIEARIVLAEQAVAAGSLEPSQLRTVYQSLDLKQDTDLPLLTKVAPEDIRGRALLFQSAMTQTVPTARAEVITRAIELARLDGGEKGPDLTVVGRTYAAMIGEMEVSGELVWFAGTAARALLAAGEAEKAKAWLDLVHGMARNSLEAGVIADNMWPLERLLSPAEGDMPAGAIRTWAASVPEVVRDAQRQTLLSLFIAVGESVNPGAFAQSLNDASDQEAPNVKPAVWNGLTAAARGKRVGETAALSLIALGEDGPAHAAPATLQKVIESLMAVGRDADARSLAVEVALIRGL